MTDETQPRTENLDAAECWRLMASQPTGRIAAAIGGRIEIFPINLAVVDGTVVLRTAPGTLLSTVVSAAEVVVETDGVEIRQRVPHAWSVVVRGSAERVDSVPEEEELDANGPQPWHGGIKDDFVRVRPTEVTGRRFVVTGDSRS